MSIFGKDSPEVARAKEQRKIDKLKNKSRKEEIRLKEKEAKISVRQKNGGMGGTFVLHDRTKLPETSSRGKKRG